MLQINKKIVQDQKIHSLFKQKENECDIHYIFEQLANATSFSFESKLDQKGTVLLGVYLQLINHLTNISFRLHSNNLGYVGMSGIASGLSSLKQLKNLTMKIEQNDINLEGAFILFKELSQLTTLTNLSVSIGAQNVICQKGAISLGSCISQLTNLQCLTIEIGSKNYITPQGFGYIALGISYLKELKQLVIIIEQNNSAEPKVIREENNKKVIQLTELEIKHPENLGFEQIGITLSELKKLENLHISFQQFNVTQTGIESFAIGLSHLITLKELTLDFTQKGNNSETFSVFLGNGIKGLVYLEYLSITLSSQISQEGAISLGEGIRELSNLKRLLITIGNYCNLNEEQAFAMFSRLDKLNQLEDLQIVIEQRNQIKGKGAQGISDTLIHSLKLKKLVLKIERNNKIESTGAKIIGESISSLLELTDLEIKIGSLNQISSEGVDHFCQSLKTFKNLKTFEFKIEGDNNLEQSAIKSLNSSLVALKQLERLNFSIAAPEEPSFNLSHSFSVLRNLVHLSIVFGAENKISEKNDIGKSLCSLSELIHLSITVDWGNKLGDIGAQNIGEALSNLVHLKSLKLFIGLENNITEKGGVAIAKSFENLVNLESIDLTIDKGNQTTHTVINELYLSTKRITKLTKAKFNIKDVACLLLIGLIEQNIYLTEENFEIGDIYLEFKRVFLEDHSQLKEFSLMLSLHQSDCYSRDDINSAFKILKDLPSLTNLNLICVNQSADQEQLKFLSNSLKSLIRLEQLTLSASRFYSIKLDISQLSNLKKFKLIANNLSDSATVDLCNELRESKQIEVIELSFTNKTDGEELVENLSKSLKELTNLKKLLLNIEYMSTNLGIQKFIESCSNIQNLKHLSMLIKTDYCYKITLKEFEYLISPIKYLTRITSLDLRIEPIPKEGIILDPKFFSELVMNMQFLRYLKLYFVFLKKIERANIKGCLMRQNKSLVDLKIESSNLL